MTWELAGLGVVVGIILAQAMSIVAHNWRIKKYYKRKKEQELVHGNGKGHDYYKW